MKPPVWRRLVVPSEITLGSLHDVIQVAFGWEDMHLHTFEDRSGGRYAPTDAAVQVVDACDGTGPADALRCAAFRPRGCWPPYWRRTAAGGRKRCCARPPSPKSPVARTQRRPCCAGLASPRKLRELRFTLDGEAVRISYWLAPDCRIVLLTVFRKTKMREAAEIERAMQAQKVCEAEHSPAEHIYDRTREAQ
jgi:hypothetical protein